ncbi:hypothetical protein KAR91_17475 [Candidatus Pacearchaeota archaeon]|nr:hypothetical protein [Candidatus Pacearchaeota archaeon]
MSSIKEVEIIVHATPGSCVDDCIQRAIILSLERKCNVKLLHNAAKYIINIEKILGAVREDS